MLKAEGRRQNPEGLVLVCFAMKEEAGAFRNIAAGRPGVQVLVTGIGRKNAEMSVRGLLQANPPKLVLTCGFAGGLNPELTIGTVIFETADPLLREQLTRAGAKPAKFCCAERIAATVTEKQHLRQGTGADAVEMESEAIQACCRGRGIPCATLRVISDAADEDLPLDFNQVMTPDRRMNYFKLTGRLLKSPGKIGALLRLRKQSVAAAEKLASVLVKTIPA